MTGKFNQKAFDLAKQQANDRFPLPEQLPGAAALKAAILSGLIIGVFVGLDEFMGRDVAGYMTVGLSALVVFADNRVRWRRHAQEPSDAYDFYKDVKTQ